MIHAPSPSRILPVTAALAPTSFLGARYAGNVRRLLDVDLDERLAGFRSRPGEHPWIGEHIGKWMDAASRVVRDTGNPTLRAKLDSAVSALIATQEDDGYLGTYPPGVRFGLEEGADWDVWVHKYCLIGLLADHEATGRPESLNAARRAADLLVATFHDPGPRDILKAGTHVGMAATSVLEPIVALAERTGDARYLDFAHGIVRAWDRPQGPHVLTALLETGRVSAVGNGKAYEMLSNIVGLADLARLTGNARARRAAMTAWDDIVAHHRYLTGTASYGEHFHQPGELPDSTSVNMGETCVTVTWLQLTDRLLRMTGDARYAAEIERTVFNHLAGAQSTDGSAWCYYSPLDGRRDYGSGVSCCISSGPRGVSMLATSVFGYVPDDGALVVLQYVPAEAELVVNGRRIHVALETGMPFRGDVRLTVTALDGEPLDLPVRLRRPEWAEPGPEWIAASAPGVELDLGVRLDAVTGEGWNAGRRAWRHGPLVLAYRAEGDLPGILDVADGEPVGVLADERDRLDWSVANEFAPGGRRSAVVAPFALLGQDGGPVRVWANDHPASVERSVLDGGVASMSSGEATRASFTDYDLLSFASTLDGPVEDEPWFAVASPGPVEISRVRFAHGRSLVHGGWFDTTTGAPRVEALRDGRWHLLGELADYPAADAVWDHGLRAGQVFELRLDAPVVVEAIRVIGRGSYGEYPRTSRFATCALLGAYLAEPTDEDAPAATGATSMTG